MLQNEGVLGKNTSPTVELATELRIADDPFSGNHSKTRNLVVPSLRHRVGDVNERIDHQHVFQRQAKDKYTKYSRTRQRRFVSNHNYDSTFLVHWIYALICFFQGRFTCISGLCFNKHAAIVAQ